MKEFKNDTNELIVWADGQEYISHKCYKHIKKSDNTYEHEDVRQKIGLRNKKVGNERIVANAWQQFVQNDKILNERSYRLVLKLLKNVPKENNKSDNSENQSGGGIVGVLTKGLKFISGK